MRVALGSLLAGALCLSGCSEQAAQHPSSDAAQATAPSFTRTTSAAAVDPDAPPAVAEPDEPVGGGSAAAAATAEPEVPPAELPAVEVSTVGMHIGGGPNDRDTKAPIRQAVEAELDAFKACFGKVAEPRRGGTFGVDIRIPGEGGQAKIREPRCGLKGAGVKECLVAVFESVEFAKPPKGVPMMVSYSIRFTPK